MKPINTNIIQLVLCLCLCITISVAQAAALYKWVDDDGDVRYTDHPPIDKGYELLNSYGVVIKSAKAPKTEKELADEKKANELAQKKLEEEKRKKQLQDAKDRVLLLTFSSEEELSLVQDNRVEVIDSVIRLIGKNITTSKERRARLETNAQTLYLSKGLEVPGGLAQNIEHLTSKIESQKFQQQRKQVEKDRITQQFTLDLERYRILTNL
jgi:hypothetical protein